MLRERRPGTSLVIVADGWWTSWLARYLTHDHPKVAVTDRLSWATLRDPRVDVVVLGFPDGPARPFVDMFGGPQEWDRVELPGYVRSAVAEAWRHRTPSLP